MGAIVNQPVFCLLIGKIEYSSKLSAVVGAMAMYGQYGAACQVGPYIFTGEVFQQGMRFSQGDQLPVPVQHQTVFSLLSFGPLQFGLDKEVFILWVRWLIAPFEGFEFFFPPFS